MKKTLSLILSLIFVITSFSTVSFALADFVDDFTVADLPGRTYVETWTPYAISGLNPGISGSGIYSDTSVKSIIYNTTFTDKKVVIKSFFVNVVNPRSVDILYSKDGVEYLPLHNVLFTATEGWIAGWAGGNYEIPFLPTGTTHIKITADVAKTKSAFGVYNVLVTNKDASLPYNKFTGVDNGLATTTTCVNSDNFVTGSAFGDLGQTFTGANGAYRTYYSDEFASKLGSAKMIYHPWAGSGAAAGTVEEAIATVGAKFYSVNSDGVKTAISATTTTGVNGDYFTVDYSFTTPSDCLFIILQIPAHSTSNYDFVFFDEFKVDITPPKIPDFEGRDELADLSKVYENSGNLQKSTVASFTYGDDDGNVMHRLNAGLATDFLTYHNEKFGEKKIEVMYYGHPGYQSTQAGYDYWKTNAPLKFSVSKDNASFTEIIPSIQDLRVDTDGTKYHALKYIIESIPADMKYFKINYPAAASNYTETIGYVEVSNMTIMAVDDFAFENVTTNVNLNASLRNFTSEDKTVILYCGIYDANEKLVQAKTVSGLIPKGGAATKLKIVLDNAEIEGNSVRGFLWDANMMPIKSSILYSAKISLVVDNCSNFENVCNKSSDFFVDTRSSMATDGDGSRFYKNSNQDSFITYNIKDKKAVYITAFYHFGFYENNNINHIKLMTAGSGENFTDVSNLQISEPENMPSAPNDPNQYWQKVTYKADNISGDLLKIVIKTPVSGQPSWGTQIGQVRIGNNMDMVLGNNNITPPKEVSNLEAVSENGKIIFSYTVPQGQDYAGVKLYNGANLLRTTSFENGVVVARNLENGKEYNFTIKTYDIFGNESKGVNISSTPNLQPTDKAMEFDNYLYAIESSNSRVRRLINGIGGADFLSRTYFEWIGTHFSDIGWQGAVRDIKKGTLIGGGLSAYSWLPKVESGDVPNNPAKVEKINVIQGNGDFLNLAFKETLDHLIYKATLQVNAGFDVIDFDEFGLANGDYEYVKDALDYVTYKVKKYALDTYGKNVYITTNSKVGGQNLVNDRSDDFIKESYNDGTEAVDFYSRSVPYSFFDGDMLAFNNDYNGGKSYIKEMKIAHKNVYPKKFVYFRDFGSEDLYRGPHNQLDLPIWYKISAAQILASGGVCGNAFDFYNKQDAYETNILSEIATINKFVKENNFLFKDISFPNIEPKTSVKNVELSQFVQKNRDIIHMFNANYSREHRDTIVQNNVDVSLNSQKTPTKIWYTTFDKGVNERVQEVPFEYKNNLITFNIDKLKIYDLVVIEYENAIMPKYEKATINFPFPMPSKMYSGNQLKLHIVANDNFEKQFNLTATSGTVENGVFIAPMVDINTNVTITAISKYDSSVKKSCQIEIIPKNSAVNMDSLEIVDGRGDWKVVGDILENENIAEGYGNGDLSESALYAPLAVVGDANSVVVEFEISAKLNGPLINYYNVPYANNFAIVFGYQNSKNYYQCLFVPDGTARFYKVVNGTFTDLGNLTSCPFINKDTFNNYKIRVDTGVISLFCNNNLIMSINDTTFVNGKIGVKNSFLLTQYKLNNIVLM